MNDESKPETLRIFLYSHPRTRSNLFIRLLESHPKLLTMQYPWMDAFAFGPESQEMRTSKRAWKLESLGKTEEEFEEEFKGVTYQAGLDQMQELIAKAESEGRIPVIKEHVYHLLSSKTVNSYLSVPRASRSPPTITDRKLDIKYDVDTTTPNFPIPNPTLIPDRLFATLSPLITIRHPAYTFPSFLRAASSFGANVFEVDFHLAASYKWQRLIYECYAAYYRSIDSAKASVWPIVIDADKLVDDPKGQMTKLCSIMGIDEAGIHYTWDSKKPMQDAVLDAFLGGLIRSTGIVRGSVGNEVPEMEDLTKKWSTEWNEDVAKKMKEFVESAMEDYEYLLPFSL